MFNCSRWALLSGSGRIKAQGGRPRHTATCTHSTWEECSSPLILDQHWGYIPREQSNRGMESHMALTTR